MHELPVTESILKIVLAHAEKNDVRRVATIRLRVGKLSDLEDEWMQRYFDYVSRGTPAEGAKLAIERTPITLACNVCETTYNVETARDIQTPCPECGQKDARLISGREYYIKSMEVL